MLIAIGTTRAGGGVKVPLDVYFPANVCLRMLGF